MNTPPSPAPEAEALCVDASCPGNPGPMEYRGVHLPSGREIFHYGPIQATNNIGEFLAVVHALALLQQQRSAMTIYTDSRTALAWVRNRKAKTLLARTAETELAFQLVERAEHWLRTHMWPNRIEKWDTTQWGEIPADYGRKK